jgi:hypothetical protein
MGLDECATTEVEIGRADRLKAAMLHGRRREVLGQRLPRTTVAVALPRVLSFNSRCPCGTIAVAPIR